MCVRQALNDDEDQNKFIELLPRIRNAVNDEKTIEDWKFLLKNEYTLEKAKNFHGFFISFDIWKILIYYLILYRDALRLFPDNKKCNGFNQNRLVSLKMPICKIKAICEPGWSANYDEDNFCGLKKFLYLSINAKITLVTNMWFY